MAANYWETIEKLETKGKAGLVKPDSSILSTLSGMDSSRWQLELRTCQIGSHFMEGLAPLFANTTDQNVFFEPGFFSASYERIGDAAKMLLIVWEEIGNTRIPRLAFPVVQESCGLPRQKVLRAWSHPFGPLSTPLINNEQPEHAVRQLLRLLRTVDNKHTKALLFDDLPTDCAFSMQLKRLDQTGLMVRPCAAITTRAALYPGETVETFETRALSPKRSRELRRQLKKLQELGPVSFGKATSFWDLIIRFEEFLLIESLSWKGKRRTAIHDIRRTAAFARQAVTNLVEHNACSIYTLRVGEKAISSLIMLRSGNRYYPWKIAFDEFFGRYSPGVQIMQHATRELLNTDGFAGADSLATPDNRLMNGLWPDRMELQRMLLPIGDANTADLTTIENAIERETATKAFLKRLLNRR